MTWDFSIGFLCFIPLGFVILSFILVQSKKKPSLYYSSLSLLVKRYFSLRVFLAPLPYWLKVFSLIFMIVALAQPQTTSEQSEQNVEGIDIMIVMDISLSMLVADMGGGATRLSASKKVVAEFIKGRISDRIGLLVFSGESFTSVPLTLDYNLILNRLAELEPSSAMAQGTAIGVALANAVVRLKKSLAKTPVIVFLTDGENNTGFIDPETALSITKKNNIKVYTIGLGTASGRAPINLKQKDKRGNIQYQRVFVDSRINKKLMKKMADTTGGKFFMARGLNSLKVIFNKIDELEKQKIKTNKWTEHKEHFPYFLRIGIVLYILSVFLSLTVFFKGV